MLDLEKKFQKYLKKLNLKQYPIYPISGGGLVCLNTEGTLALVLAKNRYPEDQNLYSYNLECTETITVLEGGVKIWLENTQKALILGQSLVIKPLQKYAINGEAICQVDISPKWDFKQNSFVTL